MAAGMIGPFSKLKYPLQINHIYNAEEIMEWIDLCCDWIFRMIG